MAAAVIGSEETWLVLKWVPVGHRASDEEAVARTEHLKQHAPGDHAFNWQKQPHNIGRRHVVRSSGQVA
jgi:hypothetical protein